MPHKMNDPAILKVKVQVYRGKDIAMGPGKAELLDAIAKTGSISAAGRALGISYRRCWLLVEVMNRCWQSPLVEASAGGSSGGGARVTPAGEYILGHYRALQRYLADVSQSDDWRELQDFLKPEIDG